MTGSPSTMGPQDAHEDTPLLIARHGTSQECQKPTTTPLPWGQLSILLLLHLVEAITSQVIAPFLPQVRYPTQKLPIS